MIEVDRVGKIFSETVALHDVSFSVKAGEFVSIMGPSGSGKSTLLNLLSALDVPSTGAVTMAGCNISTLSDDQLTLFRRRNIGLVFQFFNLLPMLDALSNVLLPLMLEKRIMKQDRERAIELMEEVGLSHRINHSTRLLSGGEMQRVAIARALIFNPQIVLADEPTGNLDSAIGDQILLLLQNVSRGHGTTIIMVTHDNHAARHGSRLIRLKDGTVVGDERIVG